MTGKKTSQETVDEQNLEVEDAEEVVTEWNLEADLKKLNFENEKEADKKIEVIVLDGEHSIKGLLPAWQAMANLPAAALYHEISTAHTWCALISGLASGIILSSVGFIRVAIAPASMIFNLILIGVGVIAGLGVWWVISMVTQSKLRPKYIVRKNGAPILYYKDRADEWKDYYEGIDESFLEVEKSNPDNTRYQEMIIKQMNAHTEEDAYEPAFTPWNLGQVEGWKDIEAIVTAPEKSSPLKGIGIFILCVLGAVAIAAIVLAR